MKMNALTVGWFVVLALIKNFPFAQPMFTLEGKTYLTAKEGSCVEIKCKVTKSIDVSGAYWFWIKDSFWTKKENQESEFAGTVIYSSNKEQRPVSSDFVHRATYIGSQPSLWESNYRSSSNCSILICNLNKSDSGNYSFRFEGKPNWITKPPVILNVSEHPCPITFKQPALVQEHDKTTLTCSTSVSCPSHPQIVDLAPPFQMLTSRPETDEKQKSTSVSFEVNWQHDGKVFSCSTAVDKYLIRNITLTVKYILAQVSPQNIEERQNVKLTCSAKGHPNPTFTWFKNKKKAKGKTRAIWEIPSVDESHNGEYHCEVQNKNNEGKSNSVNITVTYKPEVEVIPGASVVKQGDKMILTCFVKRSSPQPSTYVWRLNGKAIVRETTHQHVVERTEPENSGFYICEATNTVGTGKSQEVQIIVEYGPRKTSISINEGDTEVRVNDSLKFTCITDANPAPGKYSWSRFNVAKKSYSSHWKFKTTERNELLLVSVQRTDEACYKCNATNCISTGEDSGPVCIQVLYAPTKPQLSMDTEVTEGQLINITCTVESFPASELNLERTYTTDSQPPEWSFTQPDWHNNILQHTFNVTSAHTGFYICRATNSEGSEKSIQRQLVVKYRPRNVTVQAKPAFVVDENNLLELHCHAQCHPPLTSVTWMKMIDGKSEIIQTTQPFVVRSVSPSDSGRYSCAVSNDLGTANSQQVDIKIKYAPKQTKITKIAEQQQPNGMSSVTLSCSSDSYPPITQYSWYKINEEEKPEKVSDNQTYTVYSNHPGSYYCIAKNEIYHRLSESVHMFKRDFMKALLIFLVLIILLVIVIVLVYRHKRRESFRQKTTNPLPCLGFQGWWNGARRRNRMNEHGMPEPFRSRDDLSPDQPHHPNIPRCQSRPDSTPASNINTVYSSVNLPSGKQGPSAQKPNTQQGGHTQDDSLNYASLHFGNKQKNKQAKAAEDVYAMVSKQKPPKKSDERLEDYENISTAHAPKCPHPLNYDTDTSEDEGDLNYSQVSFKAKYGHLRAIKDFSSSDEDETQYSQVKM
ncbi:B-cell receptor CD22 [Plectropomus leopardus]|uniref:B-cell receptor CD22 n=1 Tax=Plectropomus leopardus TaxID=160734 RepID=UPI001C4B52B8|nr:B-cell receptor CD22 [Plectropomus leopardus]